MAYYHSKYRSFKKKSRLHKLVIYALIISIIVAFSMAYLLFQIISKPNVWLSDGDSISVYIPTSSTFEEVKTILYKDGLIIHRNNFEWWAQKKKYPENIKAGKYLILNGMSNNDLVNHLRSGQQQPVKLIFNNMRNPEQLAQRVAEQLELDSASIMNLLNDSLYISKIGFNKHSISSLFIPNTYEIFWNVSAENFIKRMLREYESFWNTERKAKAEELNLNKIEVITLASIVDKETQKNDEKKIIAGVYINRLNRKWLLQADPTLIFALGDFNINRVLNVHKEIDSPYNTYKHQGLPPGPICIPSITSVDAVLNYTEHSYFYMCAKDDLSGYHAFAKNIREHNRNADKYRTALDKLRIWK